MENILLLVFIFVLLEAYESLWQKSNTFFGLIEKNYYMYQKGIFTYLSMNPTFFYTIFLVFGLGFDDFWVFAILLIKFIDILFRLYIMQKISQNDKLEELLQTDMNMNFFLRYFNLFVYPIIFWISTF